MRHFDWVQVAIKVARLSKSAPFGACIVKDDKLIVSTCNLVTENCDPTAHAEIVAIRSACQRLGTIDLTGCVMYSSCEPFAMSLAAIVESKLSGLYYAATRKDAAKLGYKDGEMFRLHARTHWSVPTYPVGWWARSDAIKMMENWREIRIKQG